MDNKIPVSVIVSVKNEELNLPDCLEQLKSFSEVIVVDSISTDKTPQIVESYDYQLVDFKWNGRFPKKRNWTLRNVPLKNDWLLFLDADEILTPSFIEELKTTINHTSHNAFWLNYNNFFMGKELKFGDKMKKLALFRKGFGEYEKIEEDSWSHLDMEIHEHPIIKGSHGHIKSPIIHNDYKGLEHYIGKHNAYSSWEAKRYLSLQSDSLVNFTKRQKIKYGLINTGLLPFIYFFYSYVVKLGIFDGKSGYYLAKYKANYFFQIQTKIKELKTN
ncbi:MAG: glycosyltransferase family 2 protein [Winogradskyella arenosi]